MVEWETFAIVAGIISLAGGTVATYYKGVIQKKDEYKTLELAFTELKTRFDIFWKVIEAELPKILIRPTHKETDELLFKMAAHKLSVEENRKLKEMLRKELNETNIDSGRAVSYVLIIARLETLLKDFDKR